MLSPNRCHAPRSRFLEPYAAVAVPRRVHSSHPPTHAAPITAARAACSPPAKRPTPTSPTTTSPRTNAGTPRRLRPRPPPIDLEAADRARPSSRPTPRGGAAEAVNHVIALANLQIFTLSGALPGSSALAGLAAVPPAKQQLLRARNFIMKFIYSTTPLAEKSPAQTAGLQLKMDEQTLRVALHDFRQEALRRFCAIRPAVCKHHKRAAWNGQRLRAIRDLVEHIYTHTDPGSDYLRKTEHRHFHDVWRLVRQAGGDFTTQVAALFHDIERYLPRTRIAALRWPIDQWDEEFRKKILHPFQSAQIAYDLLTAQQNFLSNEELDEILTVIRFHDAPAGWRGGQDFFADNPWAPPADATVRNKIDCLARADAVAFFAHTIPHFPAYLRSCEKSDEAIVKRIRMCWQKLPTASDQTLVHNLMRRHAKDPNNADMLALFYLACE